MNGLQFDQLGTVATPQADLAYRGFQPNLTASNGNAGWTNGIRPVYRHPDQFTSQYPEAPGCPGSGCAEGVPGQSGLLGLLQGMFAGIQSAMEQMAAFFNGGQDANQTAVQDATITSVGDPHLGITGTDANGNALNTHFDSMTGHQDLVDSDSFSGGYRVSTEVTQPGANGVTYNKSATITSNYGDDKVTVDKNGSLYIESGGQVWEPNSLQAGQSVTLSGGETVTKNQDGSVTVASDNGQGGTITTTLKSNGTGVDVTTQAHNVDIGGDVANHANPVNKPYHPHHPHHRINGPDQDNDGDDNGPPQYIPLGGGVEMWGIQQRQPQSWA